MNMKELKKLSSWFSGAQWAIDGKASFWPLKAKLLILKQIEWFFWNSGVITYTSRQLFLTKILRGCVTPYRFSLQKIFEKSTFFKFFCIFRISMTSWLEKWSYFWNLINFQFWPFWHFIDLQLLRPTEALSLSIKFHVSLLSHVVEVKYDCNVVIWPYFQSTPNYVQCATLPLALSWN